MITAEELLKLINITVKKQSKIELVQTYGRAYVIEALHAATKAAKINFDLEYDPHQDIEPIEVDKQSILNSYPLDNIK